jgi:lysozyme
MKSIQEQLILHEGLRLKPYRCPAGKLTIGVGRNIEDKGITKEEALFLLENDIRGVTTALERHDWFTKLDDIRKKVVVDMAFNLGVGGFLQFKKLIAALERGDYQAATAEMIDSRWHRQVGQRALRLERMMRTGEDY